MLKDHLAIFLVLLALAVYLPAINWGIPYATGADRLHAWGNDDQVPLAPLAEMHSTFFNAKPDRNIAYPWFHYFLVACAYGPYLLYILLSGGLVIPDSLYPVYPFGLTDPVSTFRYLSWIGRSVSVVLAVAAVIGVYCIGKSLWSRTAGCLGALFTMVMFPMAYYARVGNLDVPVLGWTSLGVAACAVILRHGLTVHRAVWLGIFLALAISTKEQSVGSFWLVVPVLWWLCARKTDGQNFLAAVNFAYPVRFMVASFFLSYVLANGILLDPTRYSQHVINTFTAGLGGIGQYSRHPATLTGFTAQAADLFGYLLDVMSWPLLVASVVGLLLAWRRDPVTLTIALSSLGFLLMMMPVRLSRLHHLLPVALPLNAFAGYAFAEGLKHRGLTRITTGALAGVALGGLLLQTVDLTHDMMFDSRYAAGAWLDREMQPGSRVLYFGAGLTLPPLRADVKTISVLHRDQALATIREQKPEYIIVMPLDFTEDRRRVQWRMGPHSIYSYYLPGVVFEKLSDGSLGYQLVAQFQSPRLFPWLNRPFLSYPTVNPPIHIFAREDRANGIPKLEPWKSAPHYPKRIRVKEITPDADRWRHRETTVQEISNVPR